MEIKERCGVVLMMIIHGKPTMGPISGNEAQQAFVCLPAKKKKKKENVLIGCHPFAPKRAFEFPLTTVHQIDSDTHHSTPLHDHFPSPHLRYSADTLVLLLPSLMALPPRSLPSLFFLWTFVVLVMLLDLQAAEGACLHDQMTEKFKSSWTTSPQQYDEPLTKREEKGEPFHTSIPCWSSSNWTLLTFGLGGTDERVGWSPIRIALDYHNLTLQYEPDKARFLVNFLLPTALDWINRALQVIPVQGNLILNVSSLPKHHKYTNWPFQLYGGMLIKQKQCKRYYEKPYRCIEYYEPTMCGDVHTTYPFLPFLGFSLQSCWSIRVRQWYLTITLPKEEDGAYHAQTIFSTLLHIQLLGRFWPMLVVHSLPRILVLRFIDKP